MKKFMHLIYGVLLVLFLALLAFGLYAGLTTQHKSWFDWFFIISSSLYLLFYLPYVYLLPRLKGKIKKTPYLKGNTLNIDVEDKITFRAMIALGIIGLSAVIFYQFHSGPALLGLLLVIIGARIYTELDPSPGIYKNGKYLGAVYKGFIKVGDGLTLGWKQDTETIGSLKIMKDGKEVARLSLTPEGFMELKPDKVYEVFPEIKGNIEKFKNLYKVGDYTLEYKFFQKTANASYQGVANTIHSYDNGSKSSDYVCNPTYSSLPGNIYHRDH